MLTLDDEDYELLGYARELPEESTDWFQAALLHSESEKRARATYEKSIKGKIVRKRWLDSESGKKSNRRRSRKWLAKNGEYMKQLQAAWRAKNPNYMRDYCRKYRAAKKGLK